MMGWLKRSYPLTSDAQCGEDIILYKFLNDVKEGFYIDIGCSSHIIELVTKLFYDAVSNILNEGLRLIGARSPEPREVRLGESM